MQDETLRFARAEQIGNTQLTVFERAVRQIGAGIDFGVLNGRRFKRLARELKTQLRTVPGFGSLPRWRPKLVISEDERGLPYELVVPEERLDRHPRVMLLSYLFRAHLDWVLQDVLLDVNERNAFSRRYADLAMFGPAPKFKKRLAEFGSLAAVHNGGIPMTLALGCLARYEPSSAGVVECFKTITPYEEDETGLIKPTVFEPTRRIGTREGGFQQALLLRKQGRLCRYGISREHRILAEIGDEGRSFVAVSRRVDDILHEKSGLPMIAVARTVVWTGSKASFASFFAEGHGSLH